MHFLLSRLFFEKMKVSGNKTRSLYSAGLKEHRGAKRESGVVGSSRHGEETCKNPIMKRAFFIKETKSRLCGRGQ